MGKIRRNQIEVIAQKENEVKAQGKEARVRERRTKARVRVVGVPKKKTPKNKVGAEVHGRVGKRAKALTRSAERVKVAREAAEARAEARALAGARAEAHAAHEEVEAGEGVAAIGVETSDTRQTLARLSHTFRKTSSQYDDVNIRSNLPSFLKISLHLHLSVVVTAIMISCGLEEVHSRKKKQTDYKEKRRKEKEEKSVRF